MAALLQLWVTFLSPSPVWARDSDTKSNRPNSFTFSILNRMTADQMNISKVCCYRTFPKTLIFRDLIDFLTNKKLKIIIAVNN